MMRTLVITIKVYMYMKDFTFRGKKINNKQANIALSALVLLALSACGGGGDKPSVESTSTTTSNTVTMESSSQSDAQPIAVKGTQANTPAQPTAFRSAAAAPVQPPYTVTINGHTHAGGKKIVLDDFAMSAFSNIPTANNGSVRAYRQKHSIIAGYLGPKRVIAKDDDGKEVTIQDPMKVGLIKGDITQTLPDSGKFTYSGQAFSDTSVGRLNYEVDFNSRKGSGSVTGIAETGAITLKEADIKNVVHHNALDGSRVIGKGIDGVAETQKKGRGDYSLTFFGPNAEEIGGVVYHPGGEVGVGGSRK